MKKTLIFIAFLALMLGTFTGLSATVTWSVPTDKATLAVAINDLNTVGTVGDNYVINLEAGNPQTTPAGGYIITATGTASYSITIQGNNNTITAFTPQASGLLHDAIFEIDGGDYITIQNFVMQENAANTTTAAGTNNMTEFGVAVFYASATNGAKYITIQNNTISLNRTYANTFGIYATDRHTSTAITVTADITAATGAHDYLHIYGNQISNVNIGMVSVGSATGAYMPLGLDIGGSSTGTGNTLTNYGTTGTFSGYLNVSGTVNGINLNNHPDFNISYNSFTSSSGGTTSGTLRAILVAASGTLPTTGSFARTITNNNISLRSGVSTAVTGIDTSGGNSVITLNISYNTFTNLTHSVATTSTVTGVANAGSSMLSQTFNNNTFSGLTTTTTGPVYLINNTGSATTESFNNNAFAGWTSATTSSYTNYCIYNTGTATTQNFNTNAFSGSYTAPSTSIYFISNGGAATTTQNFTYNTFTNISLATTGSVYLISHSTTMPLGGTQNVNYNSIVGTFNKTGAGGTIYCTNSGASSVAGSTINILNNNFSNITVTGATAVNGIYNNDGGYPIKNVKNNTFTNWAGGTSLLNPIYVSYNGVSDISNNVINTITSTGAITALSIGSAGTSTLIKVENHDIYGLTGTGVVQGIICSAGSTVTAVSIDLNKVHNLTGNGAAGYAYGIVLSGYYLNTSNNMIYDLKTPDAATSTAPSIAGIYVTTGTTNLIYYNSVYLNASGTNVAFSTAALYLNGGTINDIRNNIFDNKCTPGSSGRAVALWKGTTGTTYIGANSNKNIYYAGSPDGTHLIGYFSTTPYSSLAQYKAALVDRDQLSYTEDVPWSSPTRVIDLHINASTPTIVEGNAVALYPLYDTDFDGNNRNDTTPDIGADEGDFTPQVYCTTPFYQPTNLQFNFPQSTSISGYFTGAASRIVTNYLVVANKLADEPLVATPVDGTAYVPGNTIGTGVVVGKTGLLTFNATGLLSTTTYVFRVYSFNDVGIGTNPRYLLTSPLTGNKATLAAPPAVPVSITATVAGSAQINLAASPNAVPDDIIVAWAPTPGTFGSPLSGTPYSVDTAISGGGTVLYIGPASGIVNHYSLSAQTTYYYKAWSQVYDSANSCYVYSTTGVTGNATTYTAVPYTQNFNASTSLPTGWGGTMSVSATHGNSSNGLYYNLYSSATSCNTTTPIMGPVPANYQVGFDYRIVNYASYPATATTLIAGQTIQVQVSVNGGSYTTIYTIDYTNHVTSTAFATKNISLPSGTVPAGSNVSFKLLSTWSTSGDYYVDFDNFMVYPLPPIPVFAYAPSSLSFGLVPQGSPTAWQNVTVTNNGLGTLNLAAGDISIFGTNGDQFEFSAANLPAALTNGQSVIIPVRMTATSEGVKSATMRMVWSAKTNYDVALSGEGLPAGVVVVGNGTSNLNLPIYPYFGYSYSQSIFLKSEINMADKRIEKLYYYWNGFEDATNCNDWVVYMGHTSKTVFASTTDWIPTSAMTQVFAGTVNLPATAGWIEIPLTTYFNYNNSDNLVIAIDENEPSYNSSSSYFYCTASAGLRSIRHSSDSVNCDPTAPVAATATVLGYPNLKLKFGEIPQIPAFGISPTSKDYGTLQIGTTSSQVFTISNSGGGLLTINSGGITLTGTGTSAYILTDTNSYPISLNSSGTAQVTVTFAPTVASATPYTANLQIVDNAAKATRQIPLTGMGVDMTIYDLPHIVTLSETPQAENWTQYNAGVTARWGITETANAGGTTPEFDCTYASGNPATTRLISPPVSITGLSELVVKYKQQIDDYSAGCTYKFRYGYTADSFTDLWTLASASNTLLPAEEKVFTLTTELAGHNKIFFCWEIEGNFIGFDDWYIDNIKFLEHNTEINQATAVAGAVSINIPAIINTTTSLPLATSVQVSGMTAQTPLINADVAYDIPGLIFINGGLYMHITGTQFGGLHLTGAHNLGFNPMQAAYRFNNGPWTLVDPTPPTVMAPDSFFDIFLETFGKAGDDVEVVFPQDDGEILPVELSSFTAVLSAENYVNLTWVTQSETGVQGYYIYRSKTTTLGDALMVSPMIDATNSSDQHSYEFTDSELTEDGTYYYWLQNVDFNGNMSFHGPVSVYYSTTGSDPTPEIPQFTELKAVYPNPFNPTAFIPYSIANAADVSIKIYNSRGQLLRNFALGNKQPGNYQITWNGKDANGGNCGNGIYYIIMNAGKDSFQRKAVLLK